MHLILILFINKSLKIGGRRNFRHYSVVVVARWLQNSRLKYLKTQIYGPMLFQPAPYVTCAVPGKHEIQGGRATLPPGSERTAKKLVQQKPQLKKEELL